jgi:hypothetical protein
MFYAPIKVESPRPFPNGGAGTGGMQFILPDVPIASVIIRVQAQLNIAAGGPIALTAMAGSVANILQDVRIECGDDVRLPSIDGLGLRLWNEFDYQQSFPISADPATITAGTPANIDVTFKVDFAMQRMIVPLNTRGILPAHLLKNGRLTIQVASPSALYVPAASTLSYTNGTVSVVCIQAYGASNAIGDYVNEQKLVLARDSQLLTATGTTQLKNAIPVGGLYREFLIYPIDTTTASGLTVFDTADSYLSNIRLFAQGRYERENRPNKDVRDDNMTAYLFPNRRAGVYALNFTRDYTPDALLDLNDISEQSILEFTVAATPAVGHTATLNVLARRIRGQLV